MSRNTCCVPGCKVARRDGITLHIFPNLNNNIERFNNWVSNIGGAILELDTDFVHANRRVCHRHFEEKYIYSKYKISRVAVPTLHLTSDSQQIQHGTEATPLSISASTFVGHHSSTSTRLSRSSTVLETHGHHLQNVPVACEKQAKRKSRKCKGVHMPLTHYKKYKMLLKQLEKCKSDNTCLRKKYQLIKKMRKTEALQIISKHMTKSAKIFCQMQSSQSGKKKLGRRFSIDEKIMALSLYKPSPKAYRLLSKLCILPSRRTLQNLLHEINLKPGIDSYIFEHIKEKVEKMPERYKCCTLIFDEMAIGPGISFNEKNDKIIGLVDGELFYV